MALGYLLSIVLCLGLILPHMAAAQAPDKRFDKRLLFEDTLDLRLREGLEQFRLDGKPDMQHLPQKMENRDFNNQRFYMPYKNLSSEDQMPLMAIDDSIHYTLRIKRYRNYYAPRRIESYRFQHPKLKDKQTNER
jgi:hypothetical protein